MFFRAMEKEKKRQSSGLVPLRYAHTLQVANKQASKQKEEKEKEGEEEGR